MNNGIVDKLKGIWIAKWYYVLAVLAYTFNMFFEVVRPGVCGTILLLLVGLELVIKKRISIKQVEDKLVTAYFIYNALSVIWLHLGGLPVSVYVQEFVVSLMPVFFYFVGRFTVCGSDVNKSDINESYMDFLMMFTIAISFVGIVGILLQVFAPQFYIDYSYKLLFISKADASTMRVRMDSVVGSTVLGFISVAAMLTSIPFVMEKKSRILGVGLMALNLIVAFMSNQRSAMVVAILVVLYFNYLLFFEFKTINKKYFIIEVSIIAVLFIALCVVKMDAVMKIYYRLVSLPSAVGERSEQWIAAVNNMYSTWLGNGLGANGHKALFIEGTHVIADGGLVKMYCEQGIFGFSMFIYLLILTCKKGLKNMKKHYVELGIIAVALIQSIGSNILAFQLTTPVFWYAIGRINSEDID